MSRALGNDGFAEAALPFPPAALAASLPFPSTGPHGHRARMRARLLARGGAGLADYEIIEMLLFLGIPRGDTKPLAKAAINRFGSLEGVLRAPTPDLLALPGMTEAAARALALVPRVAALLARAEARARPVLADWESLRRYLAETPARPELRVLFLDSRNRLLADESAAPFPRGALARALAVQAGALIVVGEGTRAALAGIRDKAGLLALVVHDWIVPEANRFVSLATGRAL